MVGKLIAWLKRMNYPKWVKRAFGIGEVLVKDAQEEAKVMSGWNDKLVGVYYYDGWTDNPNHPFGSPWTTAWFWKDGYPERKPLQGWYQSTSQTVIDTAMQHAVDGGIDYWPFNWYYDGVTTNAPLSDNALKGVIASKVQGLKFCIAFESQSVPIPVPANGLQKWFDIIELWAKYFKDPKYLRLADGRPVVKIVKVDNFNDVVSVNAGVSHAEMLRLARERTGEDIYFVACTAPISYWLSIVKTAGYNALSMYNIFHQWANRDAPTAGPAPTTWQQLEDNYVAECKWCVENLGKEGLEFWMPATSGWDSRPWAGNAIAIATPAQFRSLLSRLYALGANSPIVRGWILYAWNEWGEGGFIEPSNALGRAIINVVRDVFKALKGK